MSRLSPSRARRRGNRLLRDRYECAILGRPLTAVHEVRGRQNAFAFGGGVVAIALVVIAVLSLMQPTADERTARLVLMRDSGALFIRVNDRWHPVANIASARLILGAAENPRVIDRFWAGQDRGVAVGIVGAPEEIGHPLEAEEVRWFVCDAADGSTTVGTAFPGGREFDPQEAVLARAIHGGAATYLLYRGQRAAVDLADPVVERVLGTAGITVHRVSSTLLNMLPEVSELAVPRITGAGEPSRMTEYQVGTVVRVDRASTSELYVVLREGVQRVGSLAADMIRFAHHSGTADIPVIPPERVAANPLIDELSTAAFPASMPVFGDVRDDLCVTWSVSGSALVTRTESLGPRTELAQGDSAGPAVDFVTIPTGRSAMVRSTVGMGGRGSRHLVTDRGVRFAIDDSESAHALGFGDECVDAPWPLIAGLPAGPDLDRHAASRVRGELIGDLSVPAR